MAPGIGCGHLVNRFGPEGNVSATLQRIKIDIFCRWRDFLFGSKQHDEAGVVNISIVVMNMLAQRTTFRVEPGSPFMLYPCTKPSSTSSLAHEV